MTKKTPPSRLKANSKYISKTTPKTLRFKTIEDADLIEAINSDKRALNNLANELLREHYKLNKK
jgi:hypothetical protein